MKPYSLLLVTSPKCYIRINDPFSKLFRSESTKTALKPVIPPRKSIISTISSPLAPRKAFRLLKFPPKNLPQLSQNRICYRRSTVTLATAHSSGSAPCLKVSGNSSHQSRGGHGPFSTNKPVFAQNPDHEISFGQFTNI